MRTRIWLLLGGIVVAVLATTAWAITNGEPDGDAHPSVALVVFFTNNDQAPNGLQPLWRCTGTLLDDHHVLSAAHCTEAPATRCRVWFDGDLTWLAQALQSGTPWSDASLGGYWGTPHAHPNWRGSDNTFNPKNGQIGQTWDIGMIVLDEAVPTSVVPPATYGTLAPVGTLDRLATQGAGADFDVVGYGIQGIKPEFINLPLRYRGQVSAVNLVSAVTGGGTSVQVSSGPGRGNGPGGTCFGDSGGPLFLRGTTTIVGIGSYVLNLNCKGTAYKYRADLQSSHDFVNSFLDD